MRSNKRPSGVFEQQPGLAPENYKNPEPFQGQRLKKGSGFLILRYSFVQVAIAFLFCNNPLFIPDFLQKIHAGRVAAAYRMCYDEVQNFKRSDGF